MRVPMYINWRYVTPIGRGGRGRKKQKPDLLPLATALGGEHYRFYVKKAEDEGLLMSDVLRTILIAYSESEKRERARSITLDTQESGNYHYERMVENFFSPGREKLAALRKAVKEWNGKSKYIRLVLQHEGGGEWYLKAQSLKDFPEDVYHIQVGKVTGWLAHQGLLELDDTFFFRRLETE